MNITFTYNRPKETGVALLSEKTQPHDPVAVFWKPNIKCDSEIKRTKSIFHEEYQLPWNELNIHEVWVESRREYELLCKIAPADRSFLVRILPPIRVERQENDRTDVKIIIRDEVDIAGAIADKFSDINITKGKPEFISKNKAGVIVYPLNYQSSCLHLARAIAKNCKIVTSDAGASEEFLCKFALPGTWHVIHRQDPARYFEAIKDLLGLENSVAQSNYCDLTPWAKINEK